MSNPKVQDHPRALKRFICAQLKRLACLRTATEKKKKNINVSPEKKMVLLDFTLMTTSNFSMAQFTEWPARKLANHALSSCSRRTVHVQIKLQNWLYYLCTVIYYMCWYMFHIKSVLKSIHIEMYSLWSIMYTYIYIHTCVCGIVWSFDHYVYAWPKIIQYCTMALRALHVPRWPTCPEPGREQQSPGKASAECWVKLEPMWQNKQSIKSGKTFRKIAETYWNLLKIHWLNNDNIYLIWYKMLETSVSTACIHH